MKQKVIDGANRVHEKTCVGFCRKRVMTRFRVIGWFVLLWSLSSLSYASNVEDNKPWDVTQARGQTRLIDFKTDEGTWMSVDISPDGNWIVFDLLANIYRVPAGGGDAECLTCDSGVALNMQPRYSPDGRQIAFISDRKSQENLWVMNADGSQPRTIFLDQESRMYEPIWTPDGKALVATRYFPHIAGYYHPRMEIWRFPLSGAAPDVLAKGKAARYRWPSLSPEGRNLYYFSSYPSWSWTGVYTGNFILRQDLKTGTTSFVRKYPDRSPDPDTNPYSGDDTIYGQGMLVTIPEIEAAELAPEVSPNGRYLAFVTRQLGKTIQYRGHEYGPRNALVVRDLTNGEERIIADPVTIDLARVDVSYSIKVVPGYAWAKDSQSLVYSEGGKIRRVYIESGEVSTIPFTAHIRREMSEMPRGKITINDDTQSVKFVQWPSGSPDGKQVAFVAAGRLWVKTLPRGKTKKLVEFPNPVIQLTPAWSPDGRRIAFTTWDDRDQGHVWTVAPDGSDLQRMTRVAGQYAYPVWLADSKRLVVSVGPGVNMPEAWTGWDVEGQWHLSLISEKAISKLISVPHETQAHIGKDRRVYFYEQVQGGMKVRSVTLDGTGAKEHVMLPNQSKLTPLSANNNYYLPMMSPTGEHVAFEAAGSIYMSPVPKTGNSVIEINANPNLNVPKRRRLGVSGGVYHRWRDANTIEFASGNHYLTYDTISGRLSDYDMDLTLPRVTSAKGTLGLRNAKIITAEGNKVIGRGDVLIENARIACVGVCDLSNAHRVIDATGKVIMPGLIDTHAHSMTRLSRIVPPHQPDLATQLAYGVTTIIDPFVFSSASAFPIAEMIESGFILGPRAYTTGVGATGWDEWIKGGHLEIQTYKDAEYRVDRRLDWGALSLKNYRMNRRDQQQQFIDVARRRGVTVTGEGKPIHRNIVAVLDGQTGWEHWVPALRIFKDLTTFYGLAQSVYAPTLSICGHNLGSLFYYRSQHDLLNDPKYNRFMPIKDTEARVGTNIVPREVEYSVPIVAEGVKDIVKAGAHAAIGAHGEQVGIGAHWDLWAFVGAFTPLEAIHIGTMGGAYFHGLDGELGSISKGKIADMIILNSDPLDNIKNTLDIEYVMKGGRLYNANSLDQLWPRKERYHPFRSMARTYQ